MGAVSPNSQVSRKTSTVRMCLMGGVLSMIKEGLEAQLLPHLNRYYPPVGAILLGWEGLRCCQSTGVLVSDSPAIHVEVTGLFYIFSPQIGSVLPAKVNKRSEKHIGCLIHETFNISLMGDRMDSSVSPGEVIMIEVTKLFWGHRSVPVIQGKLLSERPMCRSRSMTAASTARPRVSLQTRRTSTLTLTLRRRQVGRARRENVKRKLWIVLKHQNQLGMKALIIVLPKRKRKKRKNT